MNESEARKKWCPFVRPDYGNVRGISNLNGSKCIASECMAWRWHLLPKQQHQMQVIVEPDEYSDTEGYCGLGVRP